MPDDSAQDRRGRRLLPPLLLLVVSCCLSFAARSSDLLASAALAGDLTELSLQDLMSIEVTSVSKRAEPLNTAAAAIFVLTGEEIRRSGARSIAEALRRVPGLQVSRTSAENYSVSSRGFNAAADKLQVLLDGRSVYTPLFSEVFWDVLDTYMPDIEHIEVIRGPGAALWGANAVNGVINIVTKSSKDTLGTNIVGSAGNEERHFSALRSGHALGRAAHVRAYAMDRTLDSSAFADGEDQIDGMRKTQAGLRADWNPNDRDSYRFTGDVYSAHKTDEDLLLNPAETDLNGGNIGAMWTRSLANGDQVSLGTYIDQYTRDIPQIFIEDRLTWNVEAQHNLALGQSHNMVYGASYRRTQDHTADFRRAVVIFEPPSRTLTTWGGFVQDQFTVPGTRLNITLGSKLEHNDFTGFEIQPSIRVGHPIGERGFTWSALSRAVRTPNRLSNNVAIFCSETLVERGLCDQAGANFRIGNPDFDSEVALTYEWGLRWWSQSSWSADLALYYSRWDRVQSAESIAGSPFELVDNKIEGDTHGAELSVLWRPSVWLLVRGHYAYIQHDMNPKAGSTDTSTASEIEGGDATHQAGLNLAWSPSPRWAIDTYVRHQSRLKFNAVPSYTELTVRAGWLLHKNLEIALIGDNLLHAQHGEANMPDRRAEFERSVALELVWKLR